MANFLESQIERRHLNIIIKLFRNHSAVTLQFSKTPRDRSDSSRGMALGLIILMFHVVLFLHHLYSL